LDNHPVPLPERQKGVTKIRKRSHVKEAKTGKTKKVQRGGNRGGDKLRKKTGTTEEGVGGGLSFG